MTRLYGSRMVSYSIFRSVTPWPPSVREPGRFWMEIDVIPASNAWDAHARIVAQSTSLGTVEMITSAGTAPVCEKSVGEARVRVPGPPGAVTPPVGNVALVFADTEVILTVSVLEPSEIIEVSPVKAVKAS